MATIYNDNARSIFAPVVALQNGDANPRSNGDFEAYSWTLKRAELAYGIAARNTLVWLADWIRANVGPVRSEIAEFRNLREADAVALARRCFLFAIVSPQCNQAENAIAARQLYAAYDRLTDYETVLTALRVPFHGNGKMRLVNLGKSKARYIMAALPWLDRITTENIETEFTYERLIACKGIGDKTASMALALYDDSSPVFTLDQWMLRLTLSLAGQNPRATIATTNAGYKLTEGDWLAWCARFVPDLTPFEVQWTLWNGCFGEHKSHLDILA